MAMVTSRGIEPRSLGLQPSAMTTPARWSEPTPGVEPGPPAYEAGMLPSTLHRRWSRLEDSHPDLPIIGRRSCCWTKPGYWVPAAGVEPAWFRLKGGHAAAASRWRCTTTNEHVGWQTWARTTICGFKVRHPAVGRSANGGVGGTRTPTYLRPRQVGYRLPNDPIKLVRPPGLEPGLGGPQSPVLPLTPQSHRYSSVKSGSR